LDRIFSSSKGQSAIEYLMSYGWMLLVVAVIGSAVFSIVSNQGVESVNGFGDSIDVDGFGLSTTNVVQLDLRNLEREPIDVRSVRIIDSEGNERKINNSEELGTGGTSIVDVWGFSESDQINEYDVEIIYDEGSMKNLYEKGSLNIRADLVPQLNEPGDWIQVKEGNNRLGTEDGFYVMKYEAKPYNTETDGLVIDGSTGTDYWAHGSYEPRSVPDGKPWINSSYNAGGPQTNMRDACQILDERNPRYNIQIMSNAQYMTLARQIEKNSANWDEENVGNQTQDTGPGGLYRGNSNIETATGCRPANSTVNATENLDACKKDGKQLRSLELNSGEYIWDLSGNAWETVRVGEQKLTNGYSCSESSLYEWHKLPGEKTGNSEVCSFVQPYSTNKSENNDTAIHQLGSAEGYNSTHGLGSIQSRSESFRDENMILRRGGSWDLGAKAGLMASSTTHESYAVSDKTGFRCTATIKENT